MLSGGVAIVFSVLGQLYAAWDYASDVNAGHPMADAPLVYLLAVAPSGMVTVVTVALGLTACLTPRGARVQGAVGIGLGILAVVFSLLQIPADHMTSHWIEPYPGGLR